MSYWIDSLLLPFQLFICGQTLQRAFILFSCLVNFILGVEISSDAVFCSSLSHMVLWCVCTKIMVFRTDLTFSLNLDWSGLLDCLFRVWYLTMILWVCVPRVVCLQRLCFGPVMNGDQPSVNPVSPLLTARYRTKQMLKMKKCFSHALF